MSEIVLDAVSKRFADGTVAVREVSLTARDGELFVLVGPSGCGKSTLLNIVAGLERPTSGEIRVGGSVVNDVDPKDRNMAMVFQSYALYPHMSVAGNLGFPLKLARRPAGEIERRVRETARVLGLEELLERAPASLSGGQRQRVAMGRAIVREPRAFLMDEPLSNLDARLRVQMRAEVARLQRRFRVTTIYVTHDQTEAMTLADRLAVLREGELQQTGTPRRLYRAPANAFVASFIGSPAMNFAPAELQKGRLRLPALECELPPGVRERLGETPRRVVLGVRPESLAFPASRTRDAAAALRVEVDMTEWVGAELLVHFRLAARGGPEWLALASELRIPAEGDDVRWVARLDPDTPARPGEPLDLHIDLERLHLFDETTGASLLHTPDEPDA